MARRKRRSSAFQGVSAQDFRAVAGALCTHGASAGLVSALSDHFARSNPRFDRTRFERAASCQR